jgi:hypothetical protein
MNYINKNWRWIISHKIKREFLKIFNYYFEIKSFENKRMYEFLGIIYFKKFLLWLMSKIIFKKKSEIRGGYFLSKYSYKGIKKYIKMTYSYEGWHLFAFILCVIDFHYTFVKIFCIILNLYCIMLQRYNRLRILEIINKYNKY